jgi:hypothetical protein
LYLDYTPVLYLCQAPTPGHGKVPHLCVAHPTRLEVDKQKVAHYNSVWSPCGGIGIRGRLRACARKGVLVRVQSGALMPTCSFQTPEGLARPSFSYSIPDSRNNTTRSGLAVGQPQHPHDYLQRRLREKQAGILGSRYAPRSRGQARMNGSKCAQERQLL